MKKEWLDIVTSALIGILLFLSILFMAKTIEFETKLKAIEAVCYSNAFENVQMWPILDIIDGELGEE